MYSQGFITLICLLLANFGCAALPGSAQSGPSPEFTWDAEYSVPGSRLGLQETGRRPGPTSGWGTMVSYRLTASGFRPEQQLVLWYKVGTEYSRVPAAVNAEGLVTVAGSEVFNVGGYVPGQPVDVALVAGESGQRAHAKVVPFPVEATGTGDCRLAAEILTKTGLVFSMAIGGFAPDDSVTVRSQYRQEGFEEVIVIPPEGEIRHLIRFEPGSAGTSTFTARSAACDVTLEYGVGPDALVVQ